MKHNENLTELENQSTFNELEQNQTPEPEPEQEQIETNIEETENIEATNEDLNLFELEKKLNENEDLDIEKAKEQVKESIISQRQNFITIDDEYIKSQPPEYQAILKSIKGETLSPKALKNYINAELYINKLKSKSETPKFQEHKTEKQPLPQPKPELNIKFENNVETTIYQILKEKHKLPELDDNESPTEKLKDYLVDVQISDPLKYYEILKDYEQLKYIVPEEYKKAEEIKNNWREINYNNLTNGYKKFTEKLSKYGLKPSDLGIDFNISDDKLGKDVYNVILQDDKNLDLDVVEIKYQQYPIVKEDKVYEKLIKLYFDKILELKNENKPDLKLKPEVPPSLSNYPTKGKTYTKPPLENILELNANEIDDEILEKYKEQLKSSIIGIK